MLVVAYCQSRKGCNMKNNEYNVEQCNRRFVCIDINNSKSAIDRIYGMLAMEDYELDSYPHATPEERLAAILVGFEIIGFDRANLERVETLCLGSDRYNLPCSR